MTRLWLFAQQHQQLLWHFISWLLSLDFNSNFYLKSFHLNFLLWTFTFNLDFTAWQGFDYSRISKSNSKIRVESRSRACSDTGRLLSAPVLTFYARHRPPIIYSTYQRVVCIVHTVVQYYFMLYSNIWHTTVIFSTYQSGLCVLYNVHVLQNLTYQYHLLHIPESSMYIVEQYYFIQILDIPISSSPHTKNVVCTLYIYSNIWHANIIYSGYLGSKE